MDSMSRARPAVVLWPDTFNNYFHPEVAKAAVEVLEDAGFRIIVPQTNMCCGRPLYDYGLLDTARRWLKEILLELQSDIEAGVPIVGLEPSCTAVFRDELTAMLPVAPPVNSVTVPPLTLVGLADPTTVCRRCSCSNQ